jgi:small-conductance mechanosensitive channel
MDIFLEERTIWTGQLDERLISTVVLIATLFLAVRLGNWAVDRAVSNEHWRYTLRKLLRYSAAAVGLVAIVGIWAHRLQGLMLVLGATGVGLAIAMAPVIVSIAGWSLIVSANLYKVGDRVQLGGVIGDVIDIGIIKTLSREIGNWVQADQMSGRVVTVANAAVFKDPVFNYTQGVPHIWDEFTVPVSYGPHWERAQSIILESVGDDTREITAWAQASLQQMSGMSLLGTPEIQPHVYLSLTEHWVACTLRYVGHARSRRTVKHRLQGQALGP